jgi:predicted transposase YdaD
VPEHDSGYKLLFTHPRMVEHLLRGYLREDWVERLDFSSLEKVGASFMSDDLRERHSDLIWRVRYRGEEGAVDLYLLIELQSNPYRFMPVRVAGYVALLLEELVRRKRLAPGRRLPPVLAIVLYRGARRWHGPRDLFDLFAPGPMSMAQHLPRLEYLLLEESHLRFDDLEESRNLAAVLFRLETVRSPDEIKHLASLVAAWVPCGEVELRRAFAVWLLHVLRRHFQGCIIPEITDLEGFPVLDANLRKWKREFKAEALQEGLQKGLQKGERQGALRALREVLLRQMELRFGEVPPEVRQRVGRMSSEAKLRKLTERVVVAESLAAVLH